jgi:glycosyltransferase involved in cell wall biosynthesis
MAERKKVVLLSAFYDPQESGAERAARDIAEQLCGRFDITVIATRFRSDLPKDERRTIGSGSYRLMRLGFGSSADKFLYPLLAPLAARRIGAGIVHAVMESYAGIALMLYTFMAGRRGTILTLQSGDLDLPEKMRFVPSWIWRLIHTRPERVSAIGHSLAERALKLGARSVVVIPNGIPLSDLSSVKGQGSSVTHRVVTIARLSPEKGLSCLIDAMAIIRHAAPDATLTIVGGGPLEGALKDQTKHLGLDQAIRFTGRLARHEAMREAASSDIFVLPSLGEGMGIVILEAQALALPVVATRVGGIPDVIEDGVTGLLVPAKDPVALAGAILKILKDPELAAGFVRAAEARLPGYDLPAIAEKYAELYSVDGGSS